MHMYHQCDITDTFSTHDTYMYSIISHDIILLVTILHTDYNCLACILLLHTWSDMDVGTSGGGRLEGGGVVGDDEEMSASSMFQRNTSVIVSITSEE